jgi:BlaI family transcriptional regulator, penicillinase repressor
MKLGKLQLRIMKTLWDHSPLTVAGVRERLGGEPLAYTTIATMLRKMEVRDLVRHTQEGRTFMYEPMIRSDEVAKSVSDELVEWLCGGSITGAVSHLLESRDVNAAELDALEALIQKHKLQQ